LSPTPTIGLPTPAAPPLRFAIAPVVSPETSLRAYQPLVDLVGARCGRKAQFITRSTNTEIGEMLRLRQCDAALVSTYVYVRGQSDYGLLALAAPVVHGAKAYHSVIIAPRGSRATGLLDLDGQRLAASDVLSTSG
jgi:ABC-type phosphate/phosphonate transport system substrate-binding protein